MPPNRRPRDCSSLAADQHDLVTDAYTAVRPAVDDDLVHGHRTGKRAALPTHEDGAVAVEPRPRNAVRVTERYDGH